MNWYRVLIPISAILIAIIVTLKTGYMPVGDDDIIRPIFVVVAIALNIAMVVAGNTAIVMEKRKKKSPSFSTINTNSDNNSSSSSNGNDNGSSSNSSSSIYILSIVTIMLTVMNLWFITTLVKLEDILSIIAIFVGIALLYWIMKKR